jgi:hypothetical protein
MKEQGLGVRGQGSAEAVDRVCQTCGHWGMDLDMEERLEEPELPDYCECLLSHKYDHLTAPGDYCNFWKGIDE